MYPWSQLAEQQPFRLDSPLYLPRLHVLLSRCHGLPVLFRTMFCSLLKPNHSTTVFIARRAEINLFISLSLTNKPYTHSSLLSVSSYQSKQAFAFMVQHMSSQKSAKTQTHKLLMRRSDSNKKETQQTYSFKFISCMFFQSLSL